MVLNNIATHIITACYKLIYKALKLLQFTLILCGILYITGINSVLYAQDEFSLPAVNKIYNNNIKTLEIRLNDEVPSYPIIQLGSSDQLAISFDELGNNETDYYYRILHCTHDWQPSDLVSNEYVNGFPKLLINNFEPSFTPSIPYTHFEFNFPNDVMSPSISGNYLLIVYPEENEEMPAFTARIVVYEQLVRYRSNVKESSVIRERTRAQEIDFDMVYNGYSITRPYDDIHQTLLQNFNWHTAIMDLSPQFVKNSEITYNYGEENTFMGGNEYRFISIASLENITNQIDSILIDAKTLIPEVYLKPDESKAYDLYTTLQDINGDFRINSILGFNDDTEAEYVQTSFFIEMDTPLSYSYKVFLFGGLTFNQLTPEYEMKYDYRRKAYTLTIPVKQGYYNYKYVVLEGGKFDQTYFEGSHFQTENDFHIFTYDSNPSLGYDRIIGFLETNTFNQ